MGLAAGPRRSGVERQADLPAGTAPRLDSRDLAFLGIALLASLSLQFQFRELVGTDGYFHIRAAGRVFAGGDAMPWLPYSVFDDGWVDHQLLLHVAMAPFAWLLNGAVAAKTSAACFAATAAFALWRLLRAQGCPAPSFFALLPAGLSWLLLLRLEMPRAQALSLALLLAGIGELAAGRLRRAAAVAFLYAWTYHVSLVLLPVAVVVAAVGAVRRKGTARLAWKGPAAVAAGLAAGFTLHPHFPRTWRFLWQHVVLKVANSGDLPVGLEWTDGSWRAFLGLHDLRFSVAGGGLVALVLACVLLRRAGGNRSDLAIAAALLAGVANLGVLRGTKAVEYSIPLSVLALALAARDAGIGAGFARPGVRAAGALLLAGLLALSGNAVARKVPLTEPGPDDLAGAAAFLRLHARPGETIFHFHWNDFPELVFHAPEFAYVVGLDPHFLFLRDPPRWRLYESLGGAYAGRRSEAIARGFGARWAVLRLPHPGAREALAADPGLLPLFDDGDNAVVYLVCEDACSPPGPASRP